MVISTSEVILQNLGASTLTEATIEILEDGNSILSYEWTGSLETYGFENVMLGTASVSQTSDVEITITSTDEEQASLFQTITMAEEGTDVITVTIQLDNWPEETTWDIRDDNGTFVTGGGPYNNQNNDEISEQVELPSLGCYIFTIYDSFGDGLNGSFWGNFTDGNYTIEAWDGTILAQGGGSVQFDEESTPFNAVQSVLSVDEANQFKGTVDLFPNPTKGALNVRLVLTENQRVTMEVLDVVGKRVDGKDFGTLPTGEFMYTTDLSHLSSGVYLISFTSGNTRMVKRITVSN
jgi:hypothetical protein